MTIIFFHSQIISKVFSIVIQDNLHIISILALADKTKSLIIFEFFLKRLYNLTREKNARTPYFPKQIFHSLWPQQYKLITRILLINFTAKSKSLISLKQCLKVHQRENFFGADVLIYFLILVTLE